MRKSCNSRINVSASSSSRRILSRPWCSSACKRLTSVSFGTEQVGPSRVSAVPPVIRTPVGAVAEETNMSNMGRPTPVKIDGELRVARQLCQKPADMGDDGGVRRTQRQALEMPDLKDRKRRCDWMNLSKSL